MHSARAENERGDVWVLGCGHALLDRGAAELAQLDAGGACEVLCAAGAVLADVQPHDDGVEQGRERDRGSEHRLR